jgi:hypothetical protein
MLVASLLVKAPFRRGFHPPVLRESHSCWSSGFAAGCGLL